MSTIVTQFVSTSTYKIPGTFKIIRPNVNQQTVIWNCKNRNMQKICKKNLGQQVCMEKSLKYWSHAKLSNSKMKAVPKVCHQICKYIYLLKNSRNIFYRPRMMYTCVCTRMCIMQFLVDFNCLDSLVIAT